MIVAVCEASNRGFTSGNNADNEKGNMMDRIDLVHEVVENYMQSLLDNPEVVRSALECYFEGFNNDELQRVLNGFEGVL